MYVKKNTKIYLPPITVNLLERRSAIAGAPPTWSRQTVDRQ